ncbi:LysR family transcriptional regulator [Phenylobacterium sp.]|jgi:DNA-binding transcriptional LysR family regulator|uniref:LysR family transcriptional regulator n=1 Tax=Phenylobacterium sp. TaxID=1871053 RepID=UPI002F3F296D
MDIRTLRAFIAAAEAENLSRAAERLNVVQSALSYQIRSLEEELQVELFVRQGRRIRLSAIGKVFLEDAHKVLEAMTQASRRVERAVKGSVGELRIGVETVGSRNKIVSEALLAFRERFPEVALELSPLTVGAILDAIHSGKIDAGFVQMAWHDPSLDTICFQKADWLLVLPRTHPLTKRSTLRLRDLEGEPFVWRPRRVSPLVYDRMLATCIMGGLVPNIAQEAYNEDLMINLVSVGLGVCFLVETAKLYCPENLVVFRKVEDFSMPVELSLAWRRDNNSRTLHDMVGILEALNRSGDG